MPTYEIEYTYNLPEEGLFMLETPDVLTMDEVEEQALLEIHETFPDAKDIRIDGFKEVTAHA
jgi:hypothetical protein